MASPASTRWRNTSATRRWARSTRAPPTCSSWSSPSSSWASSEAARLRRRTSSNQRLIRVVLELEDVLDAGQDLDLPLVLAHDGASVVHRVDRAALLVDEPLELVLGSCLL